MKPKPRDLALLVLNRLSRESGHPKAFLDEVYHRNAHLIPRDRAFINQLVQGVLRWRLRLDWVIEHVSDAPLRRITSDVLNVLRLALFQMSFLDRVPTSAAINEAVEHVKRRGPRHVIAFVNAILRTADRQRESIPFPDPIKEQPLYLSVFHSYPLWLVEKWIDQWGAAFTERLLEAGNRVPRLSVRVNQIKLDRDQLISRLAEEGVAGIPCTYSPVGVVLDNVKGRVDALRAFREGLFQVQDEAAQIVSQCLAPQAAEAVIDICAGLGGKATHLAELMMGQGVVLSLDKAPRRLVILSESARRLGIKGIVTVAADATESLESLFPKGFDKIVVDAPCSGLGVLARHPDGKWNRNASDVGRLGQIQIDMLRQAASILRRGGKMLFAVCTLSREENEDVVENLLAYQKDIVLQDLRDVAPVWVRPLIDDRGFLKTFPHIHHMDGFFAALFKKI
jgi:16S rRNA (cytosine967-C5)-methyltransferase